TPPQRDLPRLSGAVSASLFGRCESGGVWRTTKDAQHIAAAKPRAVFKRVNVACCFAALSFNILCIYVVDGRVLCLRALVACGYAFVEVSPPSVWQNVGQARIRNPPTFRRAKFRARE